MAHNETDPFLIMPYIRLNLEKCEQKDACVIWLLLLQLPKPLKINSESREFSITRGVAQKSGS